MSKNILLINEDKELLNVWKEQLKYYKEHEFTLEHSYISSETLINNKYFHMIVLNEEASKNIVEEFYIKHANALNNLKVVIISKSSNEPILL